MPQRILLNWNQPLLPQAAAWLIDRHKSSYSIDLSNTILLLPGGRSGRLLLKHLLITAEKQKLQIVPPQVVTPGFLIEALCPNLGPLAEPPEQLACWRAALKNLRRESLNRLFPELEQQQEFMSLHAIAQSLADLHNQLGGGGCSFLDVQKTLNNQYSDLPGEMSRWAILHDLQTEYYQQLTNLNLDDPLQARANSTPQPNPDLEIILIGITELNALSRNALEHFKNQTTAIIHAPESLASRFDDYGCVIPDRWCGQLVDIKEHTIKVAGRPADQARMVLETLAELSGRYAASQVTVGLGDARLGSLLQQRGSWAGINFHAAEGRSLRKSPPCILLESIADWREEPRFATFAALLRHPDLEQWVQTHVKTEVTDWLAILDRYFQDHLDERFAGEWLGEQGPKLKVLYEGVNELLKPLYTKSLTQGAWSAPILQVLRSLYGERLKNEDSTESDRLCRESCTQLRNILASQASMLPELQVEINASDALRLLLDECAQVSLTSPVRSDQIEMLGWLELHLDDAPVLILTGVNEGLIPGSLAGDTYLPESLRTKLGLPDNDSRYARDAYLIQAIAQSREHAVFITGREAADGDGLTPSRLLLACPDDALVARVQRMCGKVEAETTAITFGISSSNDGQSDDETAFAPPPLPDDLAPPTSMSVTSFRDYLDCPYRFALKHLLKLRVVPAEALELDPLQFGILAHEVLQKFGEDKEIADSTNPNKIGKFLSATLSQCVIDRYGKHPIPTVRMQQARLERRMIGFARYQAQHRAEGWEIRHCEWSFREDYFLDIPGQESMQITGTIDRLDVRQTSAGEEFAIIDYKSGDSAKSPKQAHLEGGEWCNLQLPLYHHLARQRGIEGPITLGFLVLPKKVDGAKLLEAEWDQEDIDGAIEVARGVVQNIRAGEFEMETEKIRRFDDYASICYANAFRAEDEEESDEGGDE